MSLISTLSNHIWDIFQIDLWSYYLFFWLSKHRHSFHPILYLKLWPKLSYYDPVAHANDIQHLLGTLQENLETQVYQDRLSYRKDIYVLGWRHIDIITAINVVANNILFIKQQLWQNLLLHSVGEVEPSVSVVVLKGHGQQLVCPHCGW